jgi:hypothetical protein
MLVLQLNKQITMHRLFIHMSNDMGVGMGQIEWVCGKIRSCEVSHLGAELWKVFSVSLVRGRPAGMENTIMTLGGAVVYSIHRAREVEQMSFKSGCGFSLSVLCLQGVRSVWSRRCKSKGRVRGAYGCGRQRLNLF